MKTVICKICGRTFETEKPNKKYCCFSCKMAAQQITRMKWNERNPDYNKEYQRKYRAAHKCIDNDKSKSIL